MKNKGKTVKILSAVLAVIIGMAVCICVYLYENGLFKPAHNNVKVKDGQIKVACVGDSVTYGMRMKNWNENAYPFVLRSLLGEGYCVQNFGFSGRTVMLSGDRPYMNEKLYRQSLEFEPDIVILQIGSNDSKPYNWKDSETFKADYQTLLDSYKNLSSNPKIFICTPPPAFAVNGVVAYDIQAETISNEITFAIREIAQEEDIEVIELQELFDGKSELFVDGLHPNVDGGKLLAYAVYEVINK